MADQVAVAIEIEGFDPLSFDASDSETTKMLDEQSRRIVNNILKSYTGYFDLFSELIQNALDATEAKAREAGASYAPKIWIDIDIENSRIRVTDNGIGMTPQQLKYFAKPNVSFKPIKEYRGQKGVGATFLAYGFSLIRVHTRKDDAPHSILLRQGRQWAQDQSDTVPRPRLERDPFTLPHVPGGEDGTSVEVVVGGTSGERPRRFDWLGARTARQWIDVLRIKTPLGGVYIGTGHSAPTVCVIVRDSTGSTTTETVVKPEYFWPHEIPNIKVAEVVELEGALAKIEGSGEDRNAKLDSKYKRLDCLYQIYSTDQLLSEDWWFSKTLDEEQRALVRQHQVVVYSAFLRSAKMWGDLNDEVFGLYKNQRLIKGGLQLASDFMVQGDASIIPLTSTIGYQANSHVVVHFTDGSPDMGRKAFQPELEETAKRISVQCVNIFKRYLNYLKPDTGAVAVTPDRELHEWKKSQETYRDKNALSFKNENGRIALISAPQQEQDVIALFHELVGLGVVRGLEFLATSQSDRYDSLYFLNYPDEDWIRFSKTANPLGVGSGLTLPYHSEPRVLEYKFDLDALVRDFSTESKFPKHIDLAICWQATKQFKERYFLNSLLIGDEGATRLTFGSTHQAFAAGSSQPEFEVVILEDLLRYLQSPTEEEARQRLRYSD
jgi:hypothetical protein